MKRALPVLGVLLFSAAAAVFAQEPDKMEADARRAFDAGRFQEAAEKFARAADAPDLSAERKSDLYFQSAWAYFIGGNSKASRENLKAAFTARPNLDIVADFYSPDFVRLAQTVRAEVSGANAPTADLSELKRMAREKLADNKAEEALYDLKRAEKSTDPQIHRLMADAYDKLGRSAEADASRRRAAELEKTAVTAAPLPGSAPAAPAAPATPGGVAGAGVGGSGGVSVAPLLESAETSLKKNDFRNAQVIASRALDVDPKNSEAHRIIADAAFGMGREADAEREYNAAIASDTSNAKAELGLAALAEIQRKWSTAASHYRRALELNGKSVPAALGLGRSMEELKERPSARIAFGRAVETDPTDAAARNEYGVFLSRAEENDAAIEQFSEAVRLSPQTAVFHENLGRAYRRKGSLKEAEREFAEAGRVAPKETGTWISLGHLLKEQKRFDEAAAAYRSAYQIDPSSEEAASGLSVVLIEGGKAEEAETVLVKAVETDPKGASLWNNLGVARTRRGDYTGAVQAFQKALDLDGNFEIARANLARAEQLAGLERAAS
ncbi:MAG TPA: tetratricopeptide repeat protein [Thermoanaerobaculia bacterium]|nr:tetratricopeptide repeat protein [Thermoanaerobaculia bacterium]